MSSAASCCSSWRSPITSPRSSSRAAGAARAAAAAGILVGLLWIGAPVQAAASGVHRARGAGAQDSLRHGPTPFHVMLRSAVVPGWGQVTNHKLIKAVVVVGGEGLLVSKALDELRKENDAVDLASSIDPNLDPLGHDAALASIERHY